MSYVLRKYANIGIVISPMDNGIALRHAINSLCLGPVISMMKIKAHNKVPAVEVPRKKRTPVNVQYV